MNKYEQSNAPSRGHGVWIVALVVLCLALLGYGSTNTVSNPAFLAGQNIGYALLVWGIFYAIFVRKCGATIGAVSFIAIYGALFFGGLIGASQQKQQAIKAFSAIQQEITRVNTALVDSSGVPTQIDSNPATKPQARGEFGEMEHFMKGYIDRLVVQRNDYLGELQAIGWNSILDAQRIKNDTTLSESKTMIGKAKVVVDKYEKKTAVLVQDTRARMSVLTMSETTTKAMLAGFDESTRKASARMDEQWKLEKQGILQSENIVLLLAASKNWVVEGGDIVFSNDAELDQFNSYVQKIQEIAQQQEHMQKENYAKVNQKLEALKNAAAK